MIERVRRCDVDNPEEVTKVFNRIIDQLNMNELHNDEIDLYNEEVFAENQEGI